MGFFWIRAPVFGRSPAKPRFVPRAAETIAHEYGGGAILVSPLSARKLALRVNRKRPTFSREVGEWFALVARIRPLRLVPVNHESAIQRRAARRLP